MDKNTLIEKLNAPCKEERLNALRELKKLIDEDKIEKPKQGIDVNNHIHTTYSFSPYSPAKALWMAYMSGLVTAGIMDHDSVSGAEEFIEAGEIIGMATTVGVECRADMSNTRLSGKRINNPDQESVAYMALHGIAHDKIAMVKEFFRPYSEERNIRNKKMIEKINELMAPYSIKLSFEDDVAPLSNMKEGGSVTERHIMFALSKAITEKMGKGENVVKFLTCDMGIKLSEKIEGFLKDTENVHYEYDLLGVLKSDLIEKIYIPATKECPDVKDVIELGKKAGAISAYAYLGDVGSSVTGDKKTQTFEDSYLDLLFEEIKNLGFNAVTYMPTRNTLEQLLRIKKLCKEHGFFEISGEDINSPRQVFICKALEREEFKNLIDSTWALIGHEKMSTLDIEKSFMSDETKKKYPDMEERIKVYAEIGQK